MNSIKDLLASVKCCISSDVYMKDLSIRYGNVSTGILYDAIINRILYSILSNIEYYDNDTIYGMYKITSFTVNGVTTVLDHEEILYVTETEVSVVPDLNNISINFPWVYDFVNDHYIQITDSQGIITVLEQENDDLTATVGDDFTFYAKKVDQCFDENDICKIYEYLNKKCKTC